MNPDRPNSGEIVRSTDQNVYTGSISQWYDVIMEAGYYDHEKIADSLTILFQGRKKIFELGVGTGLLAKQMVKRGFDVTGVDFTEAMLRIAKERLGETAKLYHQNITHLHLPETYEAAYSEGGVWYVTKDKNGQLFLESHIPDFDENIHAMQKVATVLEPDSLLALGIQSVHADLEALPLKNGAVYSQKVSHRPPFIDKEYFVKQGEQTAAHQRNTYRRLTEQERLHMSQAAGLVEVGVDYSNQFMIFRKN